MNIQLHNVMLCCSGSIRGNINEVSSEKKQVSFSEHGTTEIGAGHGAPNGLSTTAKARFFRGVWNWNVQMFGLIHIVNTCKYLVQGISTQNTATLMIFSHFQCLTQLIEPAFVFVEIHICGHTPRKTYDTWCYIKSHYTSSTAQGGGGSFKNRKPIGEVGCCESGMAERSHWWIERCLISLTLSLSFSDYLPTYLFIFYVSIYLSIYLSLSLSFN